ncbi:MAG: hypothetical protein MJK07_03530, partial [Flavobacteriales bacterium]|nr:hypothetical protein [Flavobacteriales bacterium]
MKILLMALGVFFFLKHLKYLPTVEATKRADLYQSSFPEGKNRFINPKAISRSEKPACIVA